ncbi:MAG: hypothetical protein IPL46_15715 [Saprospiraceae bacterium]|nr:hypothetical protein [Saprospiraceae bacterium]
MNKLILLSLTATILLWMGCGQQADVDSMLNNAESKDKVFSAIMDDHELMTEFMTKMKSNEHATMMMQGNHDMMGKMMGEGNMMKMMKDKPDMMHNMMGEMMKDEKMMGHMMQMMNQEGMMNEECMQSCMKMMGDKGMDMGNMKEGDNDDNHESHKH